MPRIDRYQNKRIHRLEKKVKQIEYETEVKYKDTIFTGIEMADTGTIANTLLVNGLQQGQTSITRIADDVVYTSFQLRGCISHQIPTTATNLAPVYRLVIVRDMQPNGVAMTFGNLFDTTVITDPVYAPRNMDYIDRFHVYYDKVGILNINASFITSGTGTPLVTTTTQVADVGRTIKVFKKLGFKTNYGLSNAGTVADIAKNSLYMLFMSDQSSASNNGPVFNGGIRLYYKDL